MAKLLSGSELVGYIKERQAKQVRMLRQAHKIIPRLLIVMAQPATPVIETYVRLKQRYAEDILIEVDTVSCREDEMLAVIDEANNNPLIHGIIVQLPLNEIDRTDEIIARIAAAKDVDGLGESGEYVSATAEAIDWLLAGYGVELGGKQITIVGHGRLVGAPLANLWGRQNLNLEIVDVDTPHADERIAQSDITVSATGVPRRIHDKLVKPKAVVVDAGTASENGVLVGDAEATLRERDDIMITPAKGGVGPLTIAVLFDHVIQAALRVAQPREE